MPFSEWLAWTGVVYAPPERVCYRRRSCRRAASAVWWAGGDL